MLLNSSGNKFMSYCWVGAFWCLTLLIRSQDINLSLCALILIREDIYCPVGP